MWGEGSWLRRFHTQRHEYPSSNIASSSCNAPRESVKEPESPALAASFVAIRACGTFIQSHCLHKVAHAWAVLVRRIEQAKNNPAAAKVLATAGGSRGSVASPVLRPKKGAVAHCLQRVSIAGRQLALGQKANAFVTSALRFSVVPFPLACRRSASAPDFNLTRNYSTPRPKSEKPKKTRPPPSKWRRRVGVVVRFGP